MPSLVVDIQAKFAQFEQSLKRIEGSAESTASRISGAFTSVQTVLAGLGAGVAVAGLVNFAKAGIDAAASLEDLSEKTTLSVEFLSQLQVVTARTGDSLESVAQNAGRFARSVAEARAGNSELVEAFRAVGISVNDLRTQNVDALFTTFATAIANAKDPTDALGVAVRIAGKSAADAVPFYKELAERGIGLATTTTEQAAAAAKLQDEFRTLTSETEKFRRELTNFVVPILADLIRGFNTLRQLNLGEIFRLSLSGVNTENAARSLEEIDKQLEKLRSRQVPLGEVDLLPPNVRAAARAGDEAIKRLEAQRVAIQKLIFADANARPGPGPSVDRPDVRLPSAAPAAGGGRSARDEEAEAIKKLEALAAEKRVSEELRRIAEGERAETEFQLAADKQVIEFNEILLRGELERERIGIALSEQAERERAAQIAAAEAIKDKLDPTRAYERELQKIAALEEAGRLSPGQAVAAVRRVSEEFKRANEETKAGSDIARDLGLTFTSAFENAVAGSKSFRDILKGIESDLLRLGTRKFVTEPLLGGLEKILGTGASGGGIDFGGILGRAGSALGGFFGFANGGAFGPGGVQAFASGGVVSRPTLFPFASGGTLRTGLMGEAGPEAIMPLRRGRDGKLGVAGGGAPINVVINAQDVNSFRGSEAQIAATMAGVLSRAQRRNG
jgi:lambda family phage tail tape measure protein